MLKGKDGLIILNLNYDHGNFVFKISCIYIKKTKKSSLKPIFFVTKWWFFSKIK
jgi:hypothetical protein